MHIKQFEDKGLSHYSYAILVDKKIILIDPSRDPRPYYEFAKDKGAVITGVIETHPHADFISSHLEIHKYIDATIYVSEKVGAHYPHQAFDEGAVLDLNEKVQLRSINTPGHSPDSISIVLSEEGKDKVVFTGDTLFIGDVGRPDLREKSGDMESKREALAKMMYHSTRDKLMTLDDDVLVYPAHGAGSLCGKGMSEANSSTIGAEKSSNPALQPMGEEEFVKMLLEDQPFIPKYFPYNVDLNKQGAPDFEESIALVLLMDENFIPEEGAVIVDGRPSDLYKASHLRGAINLMDGDKFETWLGSIVSPQESFYLIAADEPALENLIRKSGKIGYELNIKGAFLYTDPNGEGFDEFDKEAFDKNREDFTILDIRNTSELKNGQRIDSAINIPLPELRERVGEIPHGKPIAVHCAGGYRSAAGASIVKSKLREQTIMDMSDAVKQYIE